MDTFFDNESTCILPLGAYPEEESISLITTPTEGEYYLNDNMFYYVDTPLLTAAVEKLKAQPATVTKVRDTYLKICTQAEAGDLLFTSIPYEKGWRVTINGKKAKTIKAVNALLAVELAQGEQTVELHFIPYGFILGCCVSAVSLLIFLFLMFFHHP